MKKKLTANLGLKILAVLFSIVIWFIVVNINDPVDKTVFRNVPVEILNADAITGEGKVYEILEDTDTIDVTIWAKRSILDTLGRDNIIATADMQEMNFMDTMVRIKLATNKYNDKLESIKSSTENLLVNIEDIKRVQFVIENVTSGDPADGYILGNVSSDQNLVRVWGPATLVSKVNRAEAAVDVAGLSQDVRTDATVRLYDSENNLIEDPNIKKSIEQVKVNVEILQTKTVPLIFTASGTPAEGYALSGVIESHPSEVKIAGKSSTLKNISQIEIPDAVLNVSGQNSDLQMVVDLKKYLPDNVSLINNDYNGRASVKVFIEKESTADLTVSAEDILIQGLPQGLRAEIQGVEDDTPVTLMGLAASMEGIQNFKLTAVVDVAAFMQEQGMTELTPGSYDVKAVFQTPEGVRAVKELNVKVVVSKAEENTQAVSGNSKKEE